MNSYSYKQVSDWFLSKDCLSPKKLQKLTYYAEAWSNALFGDSLINDTKFEAWVHGPVSPELYSDYKEYGWNKIASKKFDESIFDHDILELLESVWLTYGDKSANDLEALTHTEEPWLNARKGYETLDNSNVVINKNDMRDYYKSIYIGG